VGAHTGSSPEACGEVPDGFSDLPQIGECVSLFAHVSDQGRRRTWTKDSLRLRVNDSECPKAP